MVALARTLRRSLILMTVTVITMSASVSATSGTTDLQRELDRAKAGDILTIPPGTYEGPLVIRKPIQLRGEQARIIRSAAASPDTPLLVVETTGATIRGLQLTGEQDGLVIRGDHNQILDLSIQTSGTALRMENAHRNLLQGLQIMGTGTNVQQRGNGIMITNSHDNRIEDSSLDNLQDGVYLDNSERTLVRRNKISNSRYGVHMMFSHQSEIAENDLEHNVTGAMVMEDIGSRIIHNHITKQAEHVQSQGILLFRVQGAQVSRNRLDGNRIGLYVDASNGNLFEHNQVMRNFSGLQMQSSTQNEFRANTWAGNVIQAQAMESRDNRMEGNFWDDHQGLDLNGDGHSELSYQASPFFFSLTEAVPAYQLLFQAPGLAVLEDLFTNGTENWLHDPSPLMYPPEGVQEVPSQSRLSLLLVSLLLLGGGILPFWRKNRRGVSQ